ncbi:hypothetical protein AVEN_107632-1 [Araneus ventricosus]|uniref:Uncharacterized protein n=1 Tax=Araneus ventricosus TaxID=182803 RepID=A0A4Y2W862_ARAVE|nr:hypothetical protein AVEN_107632-1 [Araneus ventricosus]
MLEMEETYGEELIKTENSETIVNNEFDESERYIDKWRITESKLASLLAEKDSSSVVNESFNQNAVLRYPKFKLPTFDGNIKNWLGYWGQSKILSLMWCGSLDMEVSTQVPSSSCDRDLEAS